VQVSQKPSYEPDYVKDEKRYKTKLMQAKEKAATYSIHDKINLTTRVEAGDRTLYTELFCNEDSLSPLHEACRATIQRVEPKKNAYTAGYVELHNKVLREELLLRAENIREDQARREQYIKKQSDALKHEKKFFEENICGLKQKALMQADAAATEQARKNVVQCAQS